MRRKSRKSVQAKRSRRGEDAVRHGIPLRSASRRISVRRRGALEVDVQLGAWRSAQDLQTTGALRRPAVAELNAARRARPRRSASRRSAGVDQRQRPVAGADQPTERATAVRPTAGSIASSSRRRLPPRPVTSQARPRGRRSPVTCRARSGGTGRVTERRREVARPGGRAGRRARPARRPSRRSAPPRLAAVERLLRRLHAPTSSSGPAAGRAGAAGGQRERHLVQALIAGRAGQVVDRLAHLERVTRRRAEHRIHIGEQRDGRQPRAGRHLDDRAGQRARRPRGRP